MPQPQFLTSSGAADWSVLEAPADIAARRLLGCVLVRELPLDEAGQGRESVRLAGKIVETEAYDQSDAASHSYRGRTPRTDVMFGRAGRLYVYFTYGMHYCCNVVTGPEGHGSAVLIRAVEPLAGIEMLRANRAGKLAAVTQNGGRDAVSDINLTNGPAKFCQAFGIDKSWNGHDLSQSPLWLEFSELPVPDVQVVQTTRIGIRQAADVPWRFYIRGNPYVSRP
jgi:DNA-3-methyladenine glycosylase